jgi:hypothetical protein
MHKIKPRVITYCTYCAAGGKGSWAKWESYTGVFRACDGHRHLLPRESMHTRTRLPVRQHA